MSFLTFLTNNFNQYPDSYKFLMTARFLLEGVPYEAIKTSLFYKWLYPVAIAILAKAGGFDLTVSAHLITQISGLLAVALAGLIVTKLLKSWRLGMIAGILLLFSGARLYWSSVINPEPLNLLLEALIILLVVARPNPYLLGLMITTAILNKPENIIWLFPIFFFAKDKKVLLTTLGLTITAYLTIWLTIKPNPFSIATGSVALTNLQTLLTSNFIVSNFKTDFVLIGLGIPGLVYLTIKERRLGTFLSLMFVGPFLVYLLFNLTLEKYLVNLLLPLTIGATFLIFRLCCHPSTLCHPVLDTGSTRMLDPRFHGDDNGHRDDTRMNKQVWQTVFGILLTILLVWQTANFVQADLPRFADYEQNSALKLQTFLKSRVDIKPIALITARFEPYELATNIPGFEPTSDIPRNTLIIIDEAMRLRFPDITNQVLTNSKMQRLATFNPTGDFILSGAKYNPTKPVAVFYLSP